MDMNQLLLSGARAFMDSEDSGDAGSKLDPANLASALSGLAGTGSDGGIDLGNIMSMMQGKGLGGLLSSWLGDGDNASISGDQVSQLLGNDKISAFASQLGLSEQEAIGGLQQAMPTMVDKASAGGSLLDSVGGISGVMSMAGKLFGK